MNFKKLFSFFGTIIIYWGLYFRIAEYMTYLFGYTKFTIIFSFYSWLFIIVFFGRKMSLFDRLYYFIVIPACIYFPVTFVSFCLGPAFMEPEVKLLTCVWVFTCLLLYVIFHKKDDKN